MKHLVLFAFLLCGLGTRAQSPTWADDAAPIFFEHCASCHRDQGIAPFSLTTYESAQANASLIKWALETGFMPPWPPDPNYQHHAFERTLTDEERQLLINWVEQGAAPGNLANAPAPPVFPEGGDLPGTPDLVLQIPTYTSQATTADEYRCFVFKNPLSEDRFVTAWEIVPGNREIVHHVVTFQDESGQCAAADDATPEPGYICFGNSCAEAEMFGAWAPGGNPLTYPSGTGVRLKAGADIVIQLHYPAGSAGAVDSTQIHFFFAPTNSSMREVQFAIVADPWSTNLNTPFVIPPNTIKTFNTRLDLNFGIDFSILRVFPHMHLLGKSMKAWAKLPDGSVQPLISIPQWDFEWQGMYAFQKLIHLPDGSQIETEFTYDNTTGNPNNPNNPPQTVYYGEETTDEMLFLFMEYLIYQPGDENIVLDSSLLTAVLEPSVNDFSVELGLLAPNPVSDHLRLEFSLQKADQISIDLINSMGQTLYKPVINRPFTEGKHQITLSVNLSPGLYFAVLRNGAGQIKSTKFVAR